MTPEQIEGAARQIIVARENGALLHGIDEPAPLAMEDGYRIQDAFMASWGRPIAGWKVGATAPKVQQVYGVDEPFYGPFYEPDVYASPASPHAAMFGHHCIECEFAFRFARDLPPRDKAYAREEILDAVDVLIPSFELISPRFDSLLQDNVGLAAADCGLNGGLVLGKPYENWRELDLASHRVVLTVDGAQTAEGTGANVFGHPFNVLDWLANTLPKRGLGLNAGEIVSTGTCTGFHHIEPGQHAVADYGDVGRIEITFV
ncbi:MAG: fumarylacetoacetate hydrolase family protein [Hyphomicrobiaceae bacterium]|nr:fumarylacetoacetate hydrolase family protein [Hyphomicrobiaceae bacterium]